MSHAEVEIHRLDPSREADFLRFFDTEAFCDNPDWASCYCQCYYEDHSRVIWKERTAIQNRQRACERIAEREMRGCLAYAGQEVVGWCNAAPWYLMHALDEEPVEEASKIGVIVCFLVALQWRGQGVAARLLEAACQSLKEEGVKYIEANPRPDAEGPAQNHFGPLRMYLAAGFAIDRTDSDGSVWVRRVV